MKQVIMILFIVVLAFAIGKNYIVGSGSTSFEQQGKKVTDHSSTYITNNLP